jgi:acyl carrier protein
MMALLGMAVDRQLDVDKPILEYGLDSLSALELRDWICEFFSVELRIFDILGETTFNTAGLAITKKLKENRSRSSVETSK